MTSSGRNTICTPKITKQVADLIKLGNSNVDAVTLAGISQATFYKWLQRGQAELDRVESSQRAKIRKREQPFVQFLEAKKQAVPQRKAALINRIQKASIGGEEILETKEKYETINNKPVLIERTVTVKHRHAEWQATAWLLERLHYDEFGKRSRVEVVDWRAEVKELWNTGKLTREDVINELGPEDASAFFISEGIQAEGNRETTPENGNEQQG